MADVLDVLVGSGAIVVVLLILAPLLIAHACYLIAGHQKRTWQAIDRLRASLHAETRAEPSLESLLREVDEDDARPTPRRQGSHRAHMPPAVQWLLAALIVLMTMMALFAILALA